MSARALDMLATLLAVVRVEHSRCRDAASRLYWDRARLFVRELLADYQQTGSAERIAPRIDEYLALRGEGHPVTAIFRRELARLAGASEGR